MKEEKNTRKQKKIKIISRFLTKLTALTLIISIVLIFFNVITRTFSRMTELYLVVAFILLGLKTINDYDAYWNPKVFIGYDMIGVALAGLMGFFLLVIGDNVLFLGLMFLIGGLFILKIYIVKKSMDAWYESEKFRIIGRHTIKLKERKKKKNVKTSKRSKKGHRKNN